MSEVRVYDAPSDLVGRWVRETDMQALRAENARLRKALQLCIERLEGLKEDGITKAEQAALDSAQAALQPERGAK